jgi:hypothetical protein
VGAACGTNEENRNTYMNLVATPERNSIFEDVPVYGLIILKYIINGTGKNGLD